jgi:dTMP kinase
MTGTFIVFEGIEGGGKTTQIQRLQQWLQAKGYPVVVTRQPGGTPLGRHLRQLLLTLEEGEPLQDRAELFLYAADRAQHVEGFLKPNLAAGNIILCDRYAESTVAYQGYGRGLDLAMIQQLNQLATGGLNSDLTLWLDIEVEAGLARMRQRGQADRIEQASIEFHQRVLQGYVELAKLYPDRIVRVDATGTEDEVALQIQEIVGRQLGK